MLTPYFDSPSSDNNDQEGYTRRSSASLSTTSGDEHCEKSIAEAVAVGEVGGSLGPYSYHSLGNSSPSSPSSPGMSSCGMYSCLTFRSVNLSGPHFFLSPKTITFAKSD